ncbi:MAG: dienelactone hydrolase family protein [Polyangiaceae bacterium]|jgi:carboxymethylenebutenolidase
MTTLEELIIPAHGGAPATPAVAIVPEGARRGVVVIHEIFGRQPEIDRVVERFAAAGYAAIAPDLFRRGFFVCLRDVFRAMKTGDGVAVQQGKNARAWLCAKARIDLSCVGLIGFCFGGGYALAAGSGWGAVSANYAQVPSEMALRGCGPVIACYGARDKTLRHAPSELRARLKASGQSDFEVHEFDAGHSFITDGKKRLAHRLQPMGFDNYPVAREEAWRRIFAFFDDRLGHNPSEAARPGRSDPSY